VYDNPVPIQPVWRVADDIGEIDTTGRFSALQARTGQVVATAEGISGSAQVTVEPGPLTLLKVTPESLSLSAGDTADISVVGYDAFGNPIPAQPMWQITEGIGTITPDGRLTAQKAGEGRLVPVVGHLAGLVQLRVEHGEVATLQIEPSAMQMTSGRQQQFAVQGFDRGGNQVPVDAVSWSVEGNIGAIAAQGLFTATMAESGRVVAKVGPITATAEVRVEPGEATTLRLTPETARLKAGDTLALHPEAFDAAGNRVHTTPTWMVTEDLGIVSSESVFQARRAGSGKIIASLGAAQQAIDIQVHAGPLAMVVLTPSQLTLAAGGTVDFSAMGYDAYSNAVPVEPTWSLQGNIGQIDPATGILQASTAGSGTVVAVVGSIAGLAPIRVEPATAARLHLMPSAMTVAAGDTVSFTATVFDAYNNVTAAEITWSVTEARGDLVNGTFWARRPGPTAVVARVGEVQTQAIVQVEPGPAIRLHVAPEWRELPVGTTRQLRAYAHDAYDNVWQVSATWELTGEIGQLTPAGLFTAGKQGTGQVTASLGSLAASAEVSVVPGPLQRLVLTPGQTEMAAMSSQDFTALGRDAGGNAQPVTVRWAMTQGIGHLEPTGRFTAMQVGRGTVVAYTDTLMSTAEVQVTPGPVALLFVAPPPTAVRAGETIQFQVRGIDAQRNSVSPLSVQWSVTGDIGTVDASTGVFTAKWMGWGKVQATVAGTVGSADVEVQPTIPDADRSRLMSSRTTVLADGKTAADIIVLVRDRFGNPVSNAQVTLISSREDGIEQPGPSNQQGVAIGHVRSTTPGMSDITAVMESVRTSNSLRLLFSQPGVSG